MSKKKPRTEGLEWLSHSLTSFNGSGYADKSSAEAYLTSYVQYKAWKQDKKALELYEKYKTEALAISELMLEARDATITPSPKQLAKFDKFLSENITILQNQVTMF